MDKNFLQDILKKLKKKGAEEADVVFYSSKNKSSSCRLGQIEKTEESEIQDQKVEIETQQIKEKEEEVKSSTSNGLENFDFNEEETPELFNSDDSSEENSENSFLSSETTESKEEEDDLEIPAFLRRQKN